MIQKNNLIEEVHYDGDDSFSYKYTLTYDKNGNISERAFVGKLNYADSKTTYFYDYCDRLVKEITKHKGNISIKTWRYDGKGNIIEKITKSGEYYDKSTSKYDKFGNLTEKIFFEEPDRPEFKLVYIYK
jgi:hypothetical protein